MINSFHYYAVHGPNEGSRDYKTMGFAYSDPDEVDALIVPQDGVRVENWQIIEFELRKGKYMDYQPCDIGNRVCSEKLRSIIDDTITPQDIIQWLGIIIRSEMYGDKTYYILHFPVNNLEIDRRRSIIDEDVIIMPIFSESTFSERHICFIPGGEGVSWYISKELHRKIVKAKCTGMSFTKVRVGR